jgi:peptidoglycan hydrolase CwlO-like protein
MATKKDKIEVIHNVLTHFDNNINDAYNKIKKMKSKLKKIEDKFDAMQTARKSFHKDLWAMKVGELEKLYDQLYISSYHYESWTYGIDHAYYTDRDFG